MNKYLILILLIPLNSFAQQQISNVVAPVTYFVNHVKQLNLLKNSLITHRQASIIGTSGMGKTQLARMYSRENKNNYKLIWFIDCNLDIDQELLKLAKTINASYKSSLISEDITLVRKEIMSYLSNQDKWLIIFDNLKVGRNKKIQEFVDWEHNGHVIFCSQDSEILPNIVKMTAFNKSDVSTLINNILENNDARLAEFLSKEFAGYPILIAQGAQLLNNAPGLNRVAYKKKIQQSTDKIKLNIMLTINQLKPNAKKLLNKIALMNNQSFSKELLSFITDDKSTINDDLYQLYKFALISNVDPNDTNPIFEMHDVIAQKIAEINKCTNNAYLDNIITKLIGYVPKITIKAQLFRNKKTMLENLEIIARNAEEYNTNIYKVMQLNRQLIAAYLVSCDYHNAEKLVNWFNKNDQQGTGKFKLWLMSNDEKYAYASYMRAIGGYYHNVYYNIRTATEYFTRTKEIIEKMKGYESLKWGLFYSLSTCNLTLGQTQEAKRSIQIIGQIFNEDLADKSDMFYVHDIKAHLFFMQGKYTEALEENNKVIDIAIKNGLSHDDLWLIKPYNLKAIILNYLKKYQEAYATVKQLYNMCKSSKKEDHEVFGRIFTEMAKSELGQGKLNKASEHISQAISIFLTDERKNPKGADCPEDPNLAASYVVQGDILFAQNKMEAAIESYNKAYAIYHYLYRDNRKNVAQVSYLYGQGAKAACKAKNLHSYKFFGKQQIKEFGVEHLNTASMLKYCQEYNMDLWAKGN